MSDYGDDFDDDYGDEWLYVEDEYMQADDLAEHAIASPPPTAYDEDRLDEWDRFDYFNDLEYDFEGYDDANFQPHNGETGQPKIGQKRKRGAVAGRSNKKQRLVNGEGGPEGDVAWLTNSPIIWRAQTDRGAKPKPLPENAEPYAILKDWRKLAKSPGWAQKPSHTPSKGHAPQTELASLTPKSHIDEGEQEWEDEEVMDGENDVGEDPGIEGIDPTALMAALQARLGSAGGPLSGMDPQQLLQFALRMANDQDAGDDIAAELADEMLNQGDDEEEDEEAEANLVSWVSQQRNGNNNDTSASSDAKATTDETMLDAHSEKTSAPKVKQQPHSLEIKQRSRKRKADSPAHTPAASPKKRATKSLEVPTAASSAKSAPAKTTRSGRVRR
ncbi:uncharacterized protein N0V89_003393 [Didymosphaeria variabile]|uniref:Uncharacterized protein n=1 Tax=Didymosphaeria variabile TaxID=1932322 RepID=A0A9W9CCG4_9PLEO|nr:uncharacterized protein N0V89_003393 [Didymosphaeria variabile]KAJ4355377.1 hypothetical protein N0V89_003393 [Didymosphaeria variabile]